METSKTENREAYDNFKRAKAYEDFTKAVGDSWAKLATEQLLAQDPLLKNFPSKPQSRLAKLRSRLREWKRRWGIAFKVICTGETGYEDY